jgi:hypothetical protein
VPGPFPLALLIDQTRKSVVQGGGGVLGRQLERRTAREIRAVANIRGFLSINMFFLQNNLKLDETC